MLTNEEKVRVFAMYLGCNYVFKNTDKIMKIRGVHGFIIHTDAANYYHVSNSQLLLTPLSAITDEHAIDVVKILELTDPKDIDYMKAQMLGYTQNHSIFYFLDTYKIDPANVVLIFQYLISKGYAVPLFFGIGHPDNGKTAIELGIAITSQPPTNG